VGRLLPVLLAIAPWALVLAASAAAESLLDPAVLFRQRSAQAQDLRSGIATATAALLLVDLSLRAAGRRTLLARLRATLLVSLALATVFAWWHPYRGDLRAWLHEKDAFHYFVGAKYFDELGYTRLYRCTVVADAEAGLRRQLAGTRVRDLETNRIESAQGVLRDPSRCKRHFTPARWLAFRRDVAVFRTALAPRAWIELRGDHGYNPPPAWTLVGSALANLGPVTPARLTFLTALDPALLVVAFAALAWAFGWRTSCIALIYWGTNQTASWDWVGGSILRFDWLAASVVGLCCLRRDRPIAAGLLLAWAVGVRIFPAAIVAGVALAALLRMVWQRTSVPTHAQRRFAAAFAAGFAAIVALSSLVFGPASWVDFARNSRVHLTTDSVNRIGLRPLLAYRHETRLAATLDASAPDAYAQWRRAREATFDARRPLFVASALVFVCLLVLALARQPDWAAGVLGIGMIPVLSELGSYYYAILLLFACLATRREDLGVALALLSAVSWWPGRWDGAERDVLTAWMSLAILVYVLYATLRMLRWPPPRGPTTANER
jgi:hypothetical protein